MHSFITFKLLLCALSMTVASLPTLELKKRVISQSLMDDFEWYVKYASGAYQPACPQPNGKELVKQFSISSTNTQGFVARDDSREEIIIAFRGSLQIEDYIRDAEFWLTEYESPGVTDATGKAHSGFLEAYNSAVPAVLSEVKNQLDSYPSYSLVVTGHSLGGSLASLGGVSLVSNFPGVPLRVYTFGQPRTGDPEFANLVEKVVGAENIFRATETYDGVPKLFPMWLGYRHHGTEYWVSKDPNTDPENVVKCSGQEDPNCSDSILSTGVNDAHLRYFGQQMETNPLVCYD